MFDQLVEWKVLSHLVSEQVLGVEGRPRGGVVPVEGEHLNGLKLGE